MILKLLVCKLHKREAVQAETNCLRTTKITADCFNLQDDTGTKA